MYTAIFVHMIETVPDEAEPILLVMLAEPNAKILVKQLRQACGEELFLKISAHSEALRAGFAKHYADEVS